MNTCSFYASIMSNKWQSFNKLFHFRKDFCESLFVLKLILSKTMNPSQGRAFFALIFKWWTNKTIESILLFYTIYIFNHTNRTSRHTLRIKILEVETYK